MRYQNWPITLAAFIEARRQSPFEWGKNDCCLFVADAVHAITEVDAAKPYRGKYSTSQGAYRALKKYGDGTIEGAWSACFPEIPVKDLGRGDVALVMVNDAPASALAFGHKLWIVSEKGLMTLPRSTAIKAWRIA